MTSTSSLSPAPRSPYTSAHSPLQPPACRPRSPSCPQDRRRLPTRMLPPPENPPPSPATLRPSESDQSAATVPSAPPGTSDLLPRCTGTLSPHPHPPPTPSLPPLASMHPESPALHTSGTPQSSLHSATDSPQTALRLACTRAPSPDRALFLRPPARRSANSSPSRGSHQWHPARSS